MNQSQEDYLEAIYVLSLTNNKVRVSDVATNLKVSKPSVNKAITNLKELGYINHEKYGDIELTASGLTYAKNVYERHIILKRFFVEILDIEEELAENEACEVEHCFSESSMAKLKEYLESVLN